MLPTKSPLGIRGAFKGTSHGVVSFTIRARPLPDAITIFLQRNVSIIKQVHLATTSTSPTSPSTTPLDGEEEDQPDVDAQSDELVQRPTVSSIDEFWVQLEKLLDEAGPDFGEGKELAGRVWAFGPSRVGPNILFRPKGSTGVS